MGTACRTALAASILAGIAQSKQPEQGADAVPLITEVLYAVPKGDEGDASRDGARHATGDEFVELFNPTDRPIPLAGWTITDRNPPDSGQFLFRFPAFSLGPGETVVVFNGLDQKILGPVGTADAPPEKPNEKFAD
ncbi:MAG TPA: lamin tail domain-containing protein, partial [Phycisphaerales bacterium]|nr:lamin tail domain-containing protein [Phycisphaerales bacterium]